jgi:hypothetical protein
VRRAGAETVDREMSAGAVGTVGIYSNPRQEDAAARNGMAT